MIPSFVLRCYAVKKWTTSSGIDGRLEMESVDGIKWNGWTAWNGISGRLPLEYATDGGPTGNCGILPYIIGFKRN
ncbi:MAG: hypothetical protein HQK83_19520 [Fibrobacteria bacterium]|nr:hypothetical protein [Fibrobacteria bacterium]